jgi:signal transduction histidine kinase
MLTAWRKLPLGSSGCETGDLGSAANWMRMRRIYSIAGLVFCLAIALACPAALAQQPVPRSILVLDQSDLRGPFYYEVFSGLRSAVNASPGAATTIYAEDLDLSRFTGRDYEESLQAHFGVKYRDKPVGVLVAIGSATLEYVLRRRAELWPGVPVVFAMVDEPTVARLKPPPDVTGRIMKLRFEDMMVAARAVVPELKRIAIVGDPLERQTVWRHFVEEIPAATGDVEVIDLIGLPMRELRKRVAVLPDHSAILYTSIYSDGEGTYLPPSHAVGLVAEVANRPIVVTAETFLRPGGIGGFVITPSAVGEEAARLALRVLAGEAASSIPTAMGHVVRPIFNWPQLQRWGVKESNLPPGSEIRFRNPSVWDQYRAQVLAAIAAVLVQAALIAWLLYERQQRQRSEAAAHELSGSLINAQEQERARLARELHDDVTQRLALLAIDAGREERNSSNRGGDPGMRAMREGLIRLSEDVHALSYRLHPSILEDLGLTEALKSECERFSQTCSTRLEVNARELPETLPHDVALCLFRIAQEGLRNIARHAKASRAEVSLRRLNGGLQLAITDNGAGFDPAPHRAGTSLGHASMRQRAFLLGGHVDIDSSPEHGTTILAWVPLKETRREPSARPAG